MTALADGLYMVQAYRFSAAFAIREGTIVWCAPILRRRLAYWMTIAERIGDYHGPSLG